MRGPCGSQYQADQLADARSLTDPRGQRVLAIHAVDERLTTDAATLAGEPRDVQALVAPSERANPCQPGLVFLMGTLPTRRWISPVRPRWRRNKPRNDSGAFEVSTACP